MNLNDIRAELIRQNITVTSIALGLSVSQPMVSQVISGRRKTKRVRQAIAQAIGLPVDQVFPPTPKKT